MKSHSRNAIVNPNPFGDGDEEAIAHFEELIGAELPADYRKYLLEFNGGNFRNRCFDRESGVDGRLHHIYGLHSGPKYARLSENWKLSDYYDIGEHARGANEYFVFADTGTGDLLLICKSNGSVWFLDHEAIEYKKDEWIAKQISPVLLSPTFDEFIESLSSNE